MELFPFSFFEARQRAWWVSRRLFTSLSGASPLGERTAEFHSFRLLLNRRRIEACLILACPKYGLEKHTSQVDSPSSY